MIDGLLLNDDQTRIVTHLSLHTLEPATWRVIACHSFMYRGRPFNSSSVSTPIISLPVSRVQRSATSYLNHDNDEPYLPLRLVTNE